ncbi:type 1 fimbrial protein [Proteus alimentorum]|uniref:Type 1 fimbrial protein n=1 Tax=Proteus alimentorum TaxID=1973495 RepID=A0ABS0IW48_9GAMM|nr:fimbrial protein [Proteus alimentorum]MBG2876902.1 type 1 fimbrial protein [Proteus alimentorum]MBG2880188.1 type 1 fimbrial protein [Proteus alimentorum]
MKPIIKNSLAVMLLLFPTAEVMAKTDVKCTMDAPVFTRSMIVTGNIFVGPDMPIGSVVYQGQIDYNNKTLNYECAGDFSEDPNRVIWFKERQELKILSTAGTPATRPGIPSNVFQTNNPGLGIVFYANRNKENTLPLGIPKLSWEGQREFNENRKSMRYFASPILHYSIIKIGPIQPGTFDLTNIARMQLDVNYPDRAQVDAPGFPIVASYIEIGGSITVTSSSCKTQDYTVELGSHETATLPAKGSSTKWINSDIILTNCPAFRGYYSGKKGNVYTSEVGQTFPERDPNELRVTIKPVNPAIPEYPGTFKINDVPGAAKGVGIQLAFGDVGEDFVKFNTPTSFAQPVTEKAGVVSIPLRARYIRVDDRISAGRANGAATFMIEYY